MTHPAHLHSHVQKGEGNKGSLKSMGNGKGVQTVTFLMIVYNLVSIPFSPWQNQFRNCKPWERLKKCIQSQHKMIYFTKVSS